MAAWQVTNGNVTNRGFTDGLLKAIADWIILTPAAGGPGWYIIDDQRTASPQPYIVACTHAAPDFNTDRAKFIRFLQPTTAGRIDMYYHLWWDSATHTGSNIFHYGRVTTSDSLSFFYDLRGGPNGILVSTRTGGTTWTRSMIGTWTGDANLVESLGINGTLQASPFVESGDTGNILSAYHNLTGVRDTNTDASGKLYFSIVNTTGTTYRVDIYKDSARTAPNLVAQSGTYTNTTTGTLTINQANSSGIAGSINRDATSVASTSIEVTFNRLELAAGEGAQFTVGKYYFMYDFVGNRNLAAYFKVVGITGDTLAVDHVGAKLFLSGAQINPYPHRVYCYSDNPADPSNGNPGSGNLFSIPFQSVQGGEFIAYSVPGGGNSGPVAEISFLHGALDRISPDDELYYAVMKPVIYELRATVGATSNGNRAYGTLDDMYISSNAGMAEMTDGRTIGSVDFLYMDGYVFSVFSFALLIRHTEALV